MKRIPISAALLSLGLLALPAASPASTFKFGAKLNRQPDNSSPAHSCSDDATGVSNPCTRVLVNSETGVINGNLTSPHGGVLTKIKVRAGAPGDARFVVVKLKNLSANNKSAQGKARSRSRVIHIQGNGFNATNFIETFSVKLKVKKGDYIGLNSKNTGALRCTSGSTRQLLWSPPLIPGDPFQPSDGTGNCTLMVQAVGHT
jgi:hypothetical protein